MKVTIKQIWRLKNCRESTNSMKIIIRKVKINNNWHESMLRNSSNIEINQIKLIKNCKVQVKAKTYLSLALKLIGNSRSKRSMMLRKRVNFQ